MSRAEDDPDLQPGAAGASARREHERRRAAREARVRVKHPQTAGLRLALVGQPTHEAVWGRGAAGEERIAAALAKHLRDDVVVLHHRRIPANRANIDHIAIAPSGVWVIDTKRYTATVAIARPLFGRAKLTIGGRDKTALITSLATQAERVLPMLGTLSLDGYALLYPRQLAKRMQGSVSADEVRALAGKARARVPGRVAATAAFRSEQPHSRRTSRSPRTALRLRR